MKTVLDMTEGKQVANPMSNGAMTNAFPGPNSAMTVQWRFHTMPTRALRRVDESAAPPVGRTGSEYHDQQG